MKYFALSLIFVSVLACEYANASSETGSHLKATPAKQHDKLNTDINYTSGGYAELIINQPVDVAFKLLTDVNSWPKINVGVTKAIEPENLKIKAGATFKESIASPIPGVNDWTNEWTVEEFIPNKKFVITGIDNFSKAPIHSKITYIFSAETASSTRFKRSIDVSIDQQFMQNASKQEIEALYRFLGSQWEMATHLKRYIESKNSENIAR